ncbi:MAG: hypothetical protein JSR37_10220 [Verrucomicrobia bacterium]|nr:hypothetical protein [Verrucomicrobiota bacterium]MBS0637448.1 hypothetical protein [Verrucomicrobiota bacterium]
MYTQLIKLAPRSLALAALLATCTVPALGDTKIDSTGKVALNKSQTMVLKGYEKRIKGHVAWMTKAGKASELSQEFLAVHEGMKSGSYVYDAETALKVLQELNASRKPIAPNGLKPRIDTNTQN